MIWKVSFSRRAKKELLSIEPRKRRIIEQWIMLNLEDCQNPRAVTGGSSIIGTESGWCYRVGSYRILASLKDAELIIEVVRVGHRQGVYGKLPKL